MAKLQKQCIFCSNPADSKEHFWPEWMHPHIKTAENPRHSRVVYNFSPWDGRRKKGRELATGGVQTVQVRVVCRPCNSGWMNRLEAEARPFLTPLVKGEPIVLDHDQQQIVARWIAMKCLVLEHSTDAAVTPKNYREAFRAGGAIPHYFRIYVASHSTNHDVAMRRYSHCVAFGSQKPNPPLDGVPNNIQSITFYMGRVFVHVNAARVAGFEIERFVIAPTLYENFRIWPLKHYEIVWPKEPRFTVEGVSQITFAQENLINAHKVNWVRDHPTESKTI